MSKYKHYLIVMMGPAGVGKSTLARVIENSHDDCVIMSRDKIRFSLLKEGEDYFAHENDVERLYYEGVSRMLTSHKYVIADATQITRKSRNKFFTNVNPSKDTKVIGIWVEASLQTAVKRNEGRTGRAYVPSETIKQMYRFKVPPDIEKERFDELIFVSVDQDMASSTQEAHIKDIVTQLENI